LRPALFARWERISVTRDGVYKNAVAFWPVVVTRFFKAGRDPLSFLELLIV
jgi:hypothetical protein